MTRSVKFGGQPAPAHQGVKKIDHEVVAEALKKRPGEWALVDYPEATPRRAGAMAAYVRSGRNTAYRPAGTFEAVSRTGPEREGELWVRYVGKTKTPAKKTAPARRRAR